MSVQDELNRLASTTNRTSRDCLNILASNATNLNWSAEYAANVWAATTGLTVQEAFNVKAGLLTTAVKQIQTITVGGTAETDDVFTVNLPGVDVVYTVIAADDTTAKIATKINTAIQASAGYADQAFLSTVLNSVITLTAKVAGYGFLVHSSAVNGGATNDQTLVSVVTTANRQRSTPQLRKVDALKLI